MKKIIISFKKKPIIYSLIIFFIILISYFIFFRSSNSTGGTITIHTRDFIQKLAVSGIVEASQTANLGFAQSGRIANVYANVGDFVKEGMIIAKIENGDLEATLIQKQFNLKKEQAILKTKLLNIIPGQDTLITQKYKDAISSYITSLHSTYLKIEEALIIKVDTFFMNGSSVGPVFKINTDSRNEELSIEQNRLILTEKLQNWKNIISDLETSDLPSKDSILKSKLLSIEIINLTKSFISIITQKILNLSIALGYQQSTIDNYRLIINDSGQLVSTAGNTFDIAVSSLNIAQNSYDLEKGGSTSNDIDAQTSITSSVEADVMSTKAQLEKTIVRAPFDGVITKMDAKVGEIVTSNTSSISINGNGLFLVKSNVPEVYISNLKVGNMATATLDAYGPSVKFPMKVIAIDPAQTVVNGVSNYKTTLQFLPTEKLIMSGMTANVEITTEEVPETFVIPKGSVFTENDKEYVYIKIANNIKKQEVSVGSISAVGEVNIISGLSEGDIILLSPVNKK